MYRLVIALVLTVILPGTFSIPDCLADNTWQAIGPFGGNVQTISIDPNNSQVIYAGTYNSGLLKSTNGGASWQTTSLNVAQINCLAMDPTNDQIIFAASNGNGMLKTTNGGASWVAINNGFYGSFVSQIKTLAFDPTNNQIVYAGTYSGVFKTTDGGNSWVRSGLIQPSPEIASYIYSLVIDPANGQTVYAGTGSGFYKSTDGGTSWTLANNGMSLWGNGTIPEVYSIVIDPASQQTIYIGTENGLYISTNGGESWAFAGSGIAPGALGLVIVKSIVIDSTNGQIMYAGTDSGIYQSTDKSKTWHAKFTGNANSTIQSIAIDPNNNQTIYAGTDHSGVFKSTNGGASWLNTSSGINNVLVRSVVNDPNIYQTIYAATDNGIFRSSNGGKSWTATSKGITNLNLTHLVIDPSHSQTLYAGTNGGGIFKSDDGAASWVTANTGMDDRQAFSVAIDPHNSQTLYAATNSVFKSTNGGATWAQSSSGMPNGVGPLILAIDPTNSQTLYIGTSGAGVFKSTNGGLSWIAANSGVSNGYVDSFAIDPTDGQTIFAGIENNGVLKTIDGGATWLSSLITADSVTSIVIDPTNNQAIYAGTNNGSLLKTNDGGISWSTINGNPGGYVFSLSLDPLNSQTIYSGTGKGIFKTIFSNTFATLTGSTTPTFTSTAPGAFQIGSSGWPAPGFSLSGALPSGLTFDATAGIISGTPAAGSVGTYPLVVTADNGIPPQAVKYLTLSVLPSSDLSALITTPKKGVGLASLTSIGGTASGAGISKIELQVTDGSFFLQQNGTFASIPAWLTATGTTSWSKDTSTVSWREGVTYTIQARTTKESTTSAPTSTAFTIKVPISKTSTTLAMAFSPALLRAGESASISGSLVDANSLAVSGKTVTLLITPPPTIGAPTPDPIITALTTDSSGRFTSGALSQFTLPGVYMVQARFEGTSTLAASFASQALGVTPQSGYAIIVTGKASDNSLLDMHTASADALYTTLVNKRGFPAANIDYLKSTASAAMTKEQIKDAITTWARDKLAAAPAPLYLIMIDHGTTGGFLLGDTTLTPDDLNGWMNTLESDSAVVSSGARDSYQRFVIIGTCYSGSFVPKLSKPGRVIVTSAGADEQSLAGFSIFNSATSTTYSGGEYFIDTMINFLGRGDSFKDAVTQSSSNVALRDPRMVAIGQHSGVYDTLAQHPLLDDNGDGSASYLPASSTHGSLAANLSLGVGVRSLGQPADISAVTGTSIIPSAKTGDSPLWLQANDNSRIAKAWMEIRTPITSASSSGGSGQVIPHLLTMPLYYDGLQWNSSYGFPNAGTYNILYYTQDNQTGDISPAAHSTVYKQLANNAAPSAFSLTAPIDTGGVSPMFPLTWQEVTSTNSITYTLQVATDQNFNNVVYKEEGIPQAATYIADGKLKNPANKTYYCQNGDSYCYWKVQAIDRYGTVTESSSRSFTVVATNAIPAILKGYVRNSATGVPIAGAKVDTGSGSIPTLSNGFYLGFAFNSSVSLTVSATGYQPKTLNNVSTPAASVVANDISLSYSTTAGKPGDCNGDGSVTIDEVQSAINMFLGLSPVLSCVDQDGAGTVSIAEVQKVINSFLGL